MKRFIIPILLFVVIAANVNAQDKKFEFSLNGGYSYAMPKTINDTIFGSPGGVHFGPQVTYNINELFGIQVGVLYNYYASKYIIIDTRAAGINNLVQKRMNSQYIDLPVKFLYTLALTDDIKAHLSAGPSLNYGLEHKIYYEEFSNGQLLKSNSKMLKDFYTDNSRYSPVDLKFGIGASIQYLKYSIGAGYDWGLLDRDKSKLKYKENNIKISLGYTF